MPARAGDGCVNVAHRQCLANRALDFLGGCPHCRRSQPAVRQTPRSPSPEVIDYDLALAVAQGFPNSETDSRLSLNFLVVDSGILKTKQKFCYIEILGSPCYFSPRISLVCTYCHDISVWFLLYVYHDEPIACQSTLKMPLRITCTTDHRPTSFFLSYIYLHHWLL
jgi:hypothetical protein